MTATDSSSIGPDAPNATAAAGTIDTSALNQKIVQAVRLSNSETTTSLPQIVQAVPDTMVAQVVGRAAQDAASYVGSVMQMSLAVQALVAQDVAKNPAMAMKDAPAIEIAQTMVMNAVAAFTALTTAAGTAGSTIVSDMKKA